MEHQCPKTILSVFSGRYDRMKVLVKYLRKAISMDIVQEVHLWNFTKKNTDEHYIRSIANIRRLSSTTQSFQEFFTNLEQNEINFQIKGEGNVCVVAKTSLGHFYELWLGILNNQLLVLREGKQELARTVMDGVVNAHITYSFQIKITTEKELCVYRENKLLLSVSIPEGQHFTRTFVKSERSSAKIKYPLIVNKGFYLMDTCSKTLWTNYYQHYIDNDYREDIILKCDDDIMFIDLERLPQYVYFCRNNPQCDLLLANTVNNGVSAYFQQSVYNLIPKSFMELEYPEGGIFGSLWESGEKAHRLHWYFLNYHELFLQKLNSLIEVKSRFSINFFAIRGDNWTKLFFSGEHDENDITVKRVKEGILKNYFYSDFVVSHLSFFKQEEDIQLKVNELITLYDQFADQYLSTV